MAADRESLVVDLDTAITMAGSGKFQIGLVILAGGYLAITTSDILGTSFALPAAQCEMDLSEASKGLLSGASFSGMIFTTYFWGSASDTYGRKRIMLLSLGIGWFLAVSSALAPTLWQIVLLRFLTGATYSGMASTFYAYLTEFLPPEHRARYLSSVFLFEGIMYCLMPALAWLILPLTWSLNLGFVVVKTWRLLYLTNSLWAPVTFMAALWFPESPKYLVSVGKKDEAIDVLRRVFSVNSGRPSQEYPVFAITKTVEDDRPVQIDDTPTFSFAKSLSILKDQTVAIFGWNHLRTTILGCILKFCAYSTAYGLFLWIPDILNGMISYERANPNATVSICDNRNTHVDTTFNTSCRSQVNSLVYVSSLVFGVTYCLGYTLVGALVNVIGKRTLIGVLQLSSGIAGFGIYWATDSTTVIILLIAYVLLPTLSLGPLSASLVDLYPTHLRNTALSTALTCGRIGSSLIGFVIGSLLEYDCALTIFGLGMISFVSGLLSFLLPKPTENSKLTSDSN